MWNTGNWLTQLPTSGYNSSRRSLGIRFCHLHTVTQGVERENHGSELPGQKECMRPTMSCQVPYSLENMCLKLVGLVAMLTMAAEFAIPANHSLHPLPRPTMEGPNAIISPLQKTEAVKLKGEPGGLSAHTRTITDPSPATGIHSHSAVP